MAEGRTYLVTGGTGFLGHHVIQLLLAKGCNVRVLARSPDPELEALGRIETFQGCVTDAQHVHKACEGVAGVFHLAGIVDHSRRAAERLHSVNVLGTKNVVEAAGKQCCRVVFTSTSGTVAVSNDPKFVGNDDSPYAKDMIKDWPYYFSKWEAELVAREAAARLGTELVILRPSAILGPGDTRLRATSKVWKFLKRSHPYTPSGGLSFVDVRDVALACWNAMTLDGVAGHSFLLGAVDMTLPEFFGLMEKISGVPRPRLSVPFNVAWVLASAVQTVATAVGKPDTLDPVVIEMAHSYWYLDASKAKRMLKFNPRSPEETVRDTITWLQKYGGAVERAIKAGTPPPALLNLSQPQRSRL